MAFTSKYTGQQIEERLDCMTEVTWQRLKDLRDNGQLIAGHKYRMIDYDTYTSQENIQSAMHPFDLILTALDNKTLSEECNAIQSARDTEGYFSNSNLGAWKVSYCLDNDVSRFSWAVKSGVFVDVGFQTIAFEKYGSYIYNNVEYYAIRVNYKTIEPVEIEGDIWLYLLYPTSAISVGDTPVNAIMDATASGMGVNEMGPVGLPIVSISELEGTGVIYRLVDERNNNVPYDFKNIMFKRNIEGSDYFVYTFTSLNDSGIAKDTSSQARDNVFGDKCFDNVFIDYNCHSNTFGNNCYGNTFKSDCHSNTFSHDCYQNEFSESCYSNSFGCFCYENKFQYGCKYVKFGDNCYQNNFGSDCYSIVFGDNCHSNTFGDNCYGNTFKNKCHSNTFGNKCYSVRFGNKCNNNTFGKECYEVVFGDNCYQNNFASDCWNVIFGDSCHDNTLGYACRETTFDSLCSSNTFGETCFGNKFGAKSSSNIFGNNCSYNTFGKECSNNNFKEKCHGNIFGDVCDSNEFAPICCYNELKYGCCRNKFGSGSISFYCQYITLETNSVQLTLEGQGSSSYYLQNYVMHLGNTEAVTYNLTERGNKYKTFVSRDDHGSIFEYSELDLLYLINSSKT